MDSFRLWQITQSDLPEFLQRLHSRLGPRRRTRPLAFWRRTLICPPESPKKPSLPPQQQQRQTDPTMALGLGSIGDASVSDKMTILHRIGGLANISSFSLNALATCSAIRLMKPGQVLFKEGDAITEVAFLVEGRCQLTKQNGTNMQHAIHIACLGNGELCTESIVSQLNLSRPNLQSLRHEHHATISAPSILMVVARDDFRSGLKYESLCQLKEHVAMKRALRGFIGNTSGIDQRFLWKPIRPGISADVERSQIPLTARLPELDRTSTFAFLSPRRCPEVQGVVKQPPRRSIVAKEPSKRKEGPATSMRTEERTTFDEATPNRLVQKWISAPDEIEQLDVIPKEFRLMKSKGIFVHI